MDQPKVLIVGDTHGDLRAIAASFEIASKNSCSAIISVGDLWWRPSGSAHRQLVATLEDGHAATRIPFMFVDGNNDDSDALPTRAGSVVGLACGVMYMPRGTAHRIGGRTFLAFGGAATYRRVGRTIGVDLFKNEEIRDDDIDRATMLTAPVDVVISHDAPALVPIPGIDVNGNTGENRVRLQTVIEALQPHLVIHGHYHRHYEARVAGGSIRVVGLGREHNGYPSTTVVELATLSTRTPQRSNI